MSRWQLIMASSATDRGHNVERGLYTMLTPATNASYQFLVGIEVFHRPLPRIFGDTRDIHVPQYQQYKPCSLYHVQKVYISDTVYVSYSVRCYNFSIQMFPS